MNEPHCTQRGCFSMNTCYLCFSCFCFSVSGFPSLDWWWTAAWRHSHARLLQANKQHHAHKSWYLQGQIYTHRVKMPTSLHKCNNMKSLKVSRSEMRACYLWILYSIFLQYFSLCYSLDNDVILNWNKPHQQTTTEGKEGPPQKQWTPAHSNVYITHHLFHY